MNNPTSTKQNATTASGLIVMAFDYTTRRYWHGDIFGGGGSDTTAPTVTGRSPSPSATDVAVGSNVTATFSEPVTGVSGSTFTLSSDGGPLPATITYDGPTRTATLNPSANFSPGTTYTARLLTGIEDVAGNDLAPLEWAFTTADPDETAPTVSGRSPTDLATDVAVGTNVTATFSEPVTGVSGTTFTLASDGGPVAASVTYDGPSRTATLDPDANLAADTTYTASLTAGITDGTGNALSPVTWSFTTGAAPPPSSGIAFRGASSAANATTTSVNIPRPAGLVAGDAMLATIASRGGPTITPPAGWTLVRQDISGSTMRQAVFVRIAGASEPTSVRVPPVEQPVGRRRHRRLQRGRSDGSDRRPRRRGQRLLDIDHRAIDHDDRPWPHAGWPVRHRAAHGGDLTRRHDRALRPGRAVDQHLQGHDRRRRRARARSRCDRHTRRRRRHSGVNIGQLVALRPGATDPTRPRRPSPAAARRRAPRTWPSGRTWPPPSASPLRASADRPSP